MPHDKGLPQTGDSHEIGEEAYDCLRTNRPKGWHLTELGGVNDFGYDLQAQISVKQQVLHPFRIQLKGTRSPTRSADGSFISIDLSTTTLRLYDNTDEPVLLVLCDLSVDPDDPRECALYYVWIREELDRIQIESIPLTQKEAAIRVPTSNALGRTTDLVEEVKKRHRLSRLGHALETRVAEMDPSLDSEDRVMMVEAIAKNIGTQSITFAQALAEPTTDIWVNPPRDSMAWLLTKARSAVASGYVEKCAEFLHQATEALPSASVLETAEYWHLTGRVRLLQGDSERASIAFKSAADTKPQAKYWAAWAESEIKRRSKTELHADYADVLRTLPTDSDPVLLSIRARLLTISGKQTDALAVLDTFDGVENLAARAVIQTMLSKPEEALQACIEGIAVKDQLESTRLLFLILRARARFNFALRDTHLAKSSDPESEDDVLPPSGPIGVNAAALRLAWTDIEEAVDALDEIRWASNAEFVLDIWIATASMLGKQEQIRPRVLAAARQHTKHIELQSAAETLSAQCGDYKAALEANSRLPDGNTKILRRVAFLHKLGKHRDCMELMIENISSVSRAHQLFGSVLVLAVLSADVMARDDLVQSWSDILLAGDREMQAHAKASDYLLARQKNQLASTDAIVALVQADKQLEHPNATTLLLFQELDAGAIDQAETLLAVAARVRSTIRLSPLVATRIGFALSTLERWSDLVALCEESSQEFDVTGRIKALHAFALDQLGRSDDARSILESMLEGGMEDGLALNTYVNIMVRWGFTEKAKAAAELILAQAQTKERQIECIRLLFNLEQHANPSSPRLVDLAFRTGALASKEEEVEEGVFLCLVIAATSFETAELSEVRLNEFQARANAFFDRWPQSKVLRRVEFPDDASAEDMLRAMRSAIGLSEEQERRRAQVAAQLQSGELLLPFAWRPRFALGNVQDEVHLWELAKQSTPGDKHFHLNMHGREWEQRPAETFCTRTPLFDLLTLFVLKDLDLLEKMLDFFPKIAISQATLSELANMSQVFSGGIFRERCVALQDVLKSHLAQILQPRGTPAAEDRLLPRASQELQSLAKTGDYLIYSDDAVLRLWLLEDKFKSDGICTLDLLCGLEEIGLLTAEEVATKLAQLCDWNVGIQIQLRHQLALIPQAVRVASSVDQAAALLREVASFTSMARGIWGEPVNFMDTTAHVGAVVRLLVQDSSMTNVAIGAFVAVWIDHATARTDMPLPALRLAPQIVLYAVATDKLPIEATRRLWNIYFGVVKSIQGHLDTEAISIALAQVAYEAGTLDKRIAKEKVTTPTTIGQRLMNGLDVNSSAWVAFCSTYVRGRK